MPDEREVENLERESVIVRTLEEKDLDAVVRIDASQMGRTRTEFYRDKVHAALTDSRLHTSLVGELDGLTVGFLMARLHYGEFGRPEPTAVIEAMGVHRDFRGKRVGSALVRSFMMNARALGVERVQTEVGWNQLELLRLLDGQGFAPCGRIVLERSLT